MTDTTKPDGWSSGEAYEAYIGRWSRVVAERFVAWLGRDRRLRWLDVGCGTGALTAAAIEWANPSEVLGIDPSPAYVDEARRRVEDPRVAFQARDAASIDVQDQFDVAVSGLVLNFLPDPATVVEALAKAVIPGGVVAAYVWDYAHRMGLLRYFWDAARSLDDAARDLDEGVRFPDCHPDALAALWQRARLHQVETTAIDVETTFPNFEDYWAPFLGGQGPGPGYVSSLSDAQRDALRAALYDALPIAADGSISLIARAWAVRGQR